MDFLDIDDSVEEVRRADGFAATTTAAAKVVGIAAINGIIFAGKEIFSGRVTTAISEAVEREKEKLKK
ncbi:hypothetical protein [Massilia sp. Root335]|uniref:hypothetical protein n=1 Tax=Massilia sp. Root335 TaxID=1736517 RepID=UPI000A3DDB78|nr:hypothetical protein [Massilia sp. Root335]